MEPFAELYPETLLDHARRPRNEGPLEPCTASAEGCNPLCGDRVRVQVRLGEGRVEAVRYTGRCCTVARASASIMTEAAAGRGRAELEAGIRRVLGLLEGAAAGSGPGVAAEFSGTEALLGVRDFPARVPCATLAWRALAAALEKIPAPPGGP